MGIAVEIGTALHTGMISPVDVLDLPGEEPHAPDLILTGRNASPDLIEQTGAVCGIQEVDLRYATGIRDRTQPGCGPVALRGISGGGQ